MELYLNNSKVWKYARQLADNLFVLQINVTVQREVGLKWQEFGKKWVREKQLKRLEVQLRRIKGNLWEFKVAKQFEGQVKDYLFRQYAA